MQSPTPYAANAGATNESHLKPLFIASLAGDSKSYAQLLSAISALARGYVKRKTGSHADCDDLVQEILISVHKALPTYNPARPCMPWLGAVMHYRIADWLRTRYTQKNQHKVSLDDVEEYLLGTVTEEPLAYEYLSKAVSNLPANQQAVIQAMYHEELSVVETSEKLGISVSAVKVTAHRAYKKLRQWLEDK